MKSLETLIKLQKTRVDEQRIVLSKLQARVDQIDQMVIELEISKTREQVAAQEQGADTPTYGAFLKAAVKQGRELERHRTMVMREVEIERDKLIELFEEQKRYEIAQASREAAKDSQERRRETIRLDESGSVTHQRGKEI